jgi:hypothetical protein
VTFLRLSRWDWLAFAAALVLLLTMSVDWYTTKQGQECRRVESTQTPSGGVQGDLIGRDVRRDARECAEKREKNAWQASAFIDRVILLVLLIAIAAAVGAAFLRAAGRRLRLSRSPSEIASYAGLVAALLILYRILQPPGLNEAAVVKVGAPLSLVVVGALAIFARSAAAAEREALATAGAPPPDAAQQEPPPEPPAGPAQPAPSA